MRIGNARAEQFQLDVYGEVMDALLPARTRGIGPRSTPAWDAPARAARLRWSRSWREPDEGIWEVRGPRRHFTHSKVMAWVAFDRAIKWSTRPSATTRLPATAAERAGARCATHSRRGLRARVRPERETLHAVLRTPRTGREPAADADGRFSAGPATRASSAPRGVERDSAVRRASCCAIARSDPSAASTACPPREGAFLPCSFWLADAYVQLGRMDEARACSSDCWPAQRRRPACRGIRSGAKRLLGNFPQALTHLALVGSAHNPAGHAERPAKSRGDGTKSSGT